MLGFDALPEGVSLGAIYAVTVTIRDGATSAAPKPLPPPVVEPPPQQEITPPRRRGGGGGGGGGGGAVIPSRPPAFILGARTDITITGDLPSGADVGRPVSAADVTNYKLTYSLGGPDAAQFTIDQSTGQIRVAPGTTLDYQEGKNTYTVDVTARNIFGATATTRAIITLTSAVLGRLGSRYDANNNEAIELEEVLAAIAHYFDMTVSPWSQVLELVKLYFSS